MSRVATWLSACALAFALLLPVARPAHAQAASDPAPLEFRDDAEEARFQALTHELRCVMCQNQSLADSNAQIAHDLRREVLQLMRQGRSDDEIVAFLVARYGEFVRYKPAFEPATWLLWLGPAALLLAGGTVVAFVVRRRRADLPPGTGTATADAEQEW